MSKIGLFSPTIKSLTFQQLFFSSVISLDKCLTLEDTITFKSTSTYFYTINVRQNSKPNDSYNTKSDKINSILIRNVVLSERNHFSTIFSRSVHWIITFSIPRIIISLANFELLIFFFVSKPTV